MVEWLNGRRCPNGCLCKYVAISPLLYCPPKPPPILLLRYPRSFSTSTSHNRRLGKKWNRVLRLQLETWDSGCCMPSKVFLAWVLMRFWWFPSQGVETLDQIFVSTFLAFSWPLHPDSFVFLSRILWVNRKTRGSSLNGRNEKRVWRANGITN